MRVLVYTPVQSGKLYGRALQSILRLEWPEQLDVVFGRGGREADPETRRHAAYEEITRKYNEARWLAISGDYDALLCIESDMIVPPNALTQLAEIEADVVYALYCWRHGNLRWSAYSEVTASRGVSLAQHENAARYWGHVVDVAGVGLGCTLIRRPVLLNLSFRIDPGEHSACCDWYLAMDCQARGFSQKAHLGVVCGHMSQTPSPRIIWPDPEHGARIEFLTPATPVEPGARIEIPVGMDTIAIPVRRSSCVSEP